jgi:hypothetical protein
MFEKNWIDLLTDAVRERGGSEDDLRRLVTADGQALLGRVADLIVRAGRPVVTCFPVAVDYRLSPAEMVRAGRYDHVDTDVTAEHFPVPAGDPVTLELLVVHFGREMASDEVLGELGRRGLKPAGIEHLLALGAAYPEVQRQHPVVALGSVWGRRPGESRAPYLDADTAGRGLGLGWYGADWYAPCRFAAVRQP